MQKFSKGEAIKFGFNIARSNFFFFLGILFMLGVATAIPQGIDELFVEDLSISETVIVSLATFVVIVLNLILAVGIIKIALKFVDSGKASYKDRFTYYSLFFKYLFGAMLYGLIVFVGLLLFIVPGIIWALKYQFYNYLIVDKNMGPIEALKKSGEMTQGSKMNLLLFAIILGAINFLGALAFGFGLLLTIPTTWIALAFVYRKLLAQSPTPPKEPIAETPLEVKLETAS